MTSPAAADGRRPSAPSPPAKLTRWLRTPDGAAVAVLCVLPVLVFAVPAALGHPAIASDNTIQNFPLRALSGDLMRHGHLPLWNPYIWSGSPLLGGLNAGSFYPLTFLFVVLPPVAAWVANLLGTWWAAGLGLYALGRQYRLRPLACVLGAVTYSYAGAMSGQLVHLPVVQGMGWVPLLVLAQIRLAWLVLGTGDRRTSPWRWVILLAAVVGLEALTGEPRSMAETEVVAAAVALWLVLRPYRPPAGLRRRAAYVALSVVGAGWGVALAAAELAPGWAFIRASQRAVGSYAFFGSGSLPVKWSSLLFVPDLFGGDGLFGQPTYFNHYNLAEVTGYVGLLPLGAALVLCSRSFGRRRDPGSADWGMWLGLLVLGLFLAWGSFTPLGHVWAAIPLFGRTRLQSRSLGIVDLALAVLLAFWADRALAGRTADAGLAGWRRWVTSVPALVSGGLCVAVLAAPGPVEAWFGANAAAGGRLARELAPWLAAQLAIAAAAVALVLGWRRLPPVPRRWGLCALVAADVILFALAASTGLSAGTATIEPTPARAAAVLGHAGRFAIYDTTAANIDTLSAVGQPDLNAFTRLPSVQGYGSILSATYGAATGTHALDTLDPCALAAGAFVPLRLATVLVLPKFLAPGAGPAGPPPPPVACPGPARRHAPGHQVLYVGRSLEITAADLVAAPGDRVTSSPRVGVVGPGGGTRWPGASVTRVAGGWAVRFARPALATGLVIEGRASAVMDTSTVTGTPAPAPGEGPAVPRPRGTWGFDGVMQGALDGGGWRYAGNWQSYAVFRHAVGPPVWLAGAPSGSRVTRVRATPWGTEVDRVDAARPVTVVRSEADLAGWRAEAVPAGGGTARDLVVVRHGLVQSVRIPAGRWTLTFRYRAPHLTLGLAGSGAGLAAMVAAAAVAATRRRRRRPDAGPATAAG
ncbi:MAG: hypothetical protein ACRDWN_06210 [Acidimicrobiales bacterium]